MNARSGLRPDPAYKIAYILGLAIALALSAIPLADAYLGHDVPDLLRAPALLLLYSQPALLAARAYGRRRGALMGAAFLGVPLAMTSFALISLVLLVPAWLYLRLYREWTSQPPRIFPGIPAALAFVLGVFTFLTLFLTENPTCVSFANGGSACSSDTISALELLAVAGAVGCTHQILWWLSASKVDPVSPETTPDH